jgi:hypothetical protein
MAKVIILLDIYSQSKGKDIARHESEGGNDFGFAKASVLDASAVSTALTVGMRMCLTNP